MMIKVELNELLTFLNKKKYKAEIQKETNQIYMILKVDKAEFPLFIRIFEGNEFVQLLVFIPCQIKKEMSPDLARLLHRLNKEIDLPGFGMDEESGVTFYRLMIPAFGGKLDPQLFERFLTVTSQICESMTPAVATVAQGLMTYDEMLKKSDEYAKSKSNK